MLRKAQTVLLLCQRCVGVSSYGGVVRIADMVAVMSSKLSETSGLTAKLKQSLHETVQKRTILIEAAFVIMKSVSCHYCIALLLILNV